MNKCYKVVIPRNIVLPEGITLDELLKNLPREEVSPNPLKKCSCLDDNCGYFTRSNHRTHCPLCKALLKVVEDEE